MGRVQTEMCSACKIHTRFQRVGIGLANKLVWVFLTQLTDNPERTFGPTHYKTKQNKLKRVSKISITIVKP